MFLYSIKNMLVVGLRICRLYSLQRGKHPSPPTKVKVRSPDGDIEYFNIVAGVLLGDTLAPYLFIICLDYRLRTSIALMKEDRFKLAKERNRRYPTQTIINMDYAEDIVLLANMPAQAKILEWTAGGIGLHVNADKTEYMCFNQRGNISTLKGGPLKLVDKFTYLGSSVSSTENDINMRLARAWKAIDRLSIISQFFFQVAVMSILLYGYTIWTLNKRMEKNLDGNYTRMMWAVLNKSWKQHTTKQQLCSHLPPNTKTNNEPNMQDTAGEVRMNSYAICSGEPLHMDEQR